MQVLGNVLGLERPAVLDNKILRRRRPRRQNHVVDERAVLQATEVEAVLVFQEFGEIEEFRDEFLGVSALVVERVPQRGQVVELAVRAVEPAALEVDVEWGERLDPYEVVQDAGGAGVVSAVVELCNEAWRVHEVIEPVETVLSVSS